MRLVVCLLDLEKRSLQLAFVEFRFLLFYFLAPTYCILFLIGYCALNAIRSLISAFRAIEGSVGHLNCFLQFEIERKRRIELSIKVSERYDLMRMKEGAK